tara:strand:+ start:2213 stop:2779 length:567 start_codon:yes stop_codon:yes gene_type:complete
MTRNLTSAVKTELATNDIRPVHLITIGFSTPVNLTDCSFSLTSSVSGSSVTYSASDFILAVTNHTEETDVSKSSISIALSGADQTFISTVLNENVVNDSVDIFRGFLNDSNALISDPFLLYRGKIDSFDIAETDTDSQVNLSIVSNWADFEKKNGRKTNNTSQQRFFSGDLGMDFSSQTVQDIKWGRS